MPLNWAMMQNNLGNALAALGAQERSVNRLEEAAQAYRAALEERTRERVPHDWAFTQFNLGGVEITFFELTLDPSHLDKAESYANAAREAFNQTGADHYIRLADARLADIANRR